MALDPFTSFSDDARLWIYAADRSLSDNEQRDVLDAVETFIAGWTSHGRSVDGAAALLDDRFLLVAGAVRSGDISGCGIDSSTDVIENAADRLSITWLPALHVFYRDKSGQVRGVSRPEFRQKVKDGRITRDTGVFDLSLETVGQLRDNGFERPAGDSWHAMVFRIPEAA